MIEIDAYTAGALFGVAVLLAAAIWRQVILRGMKPKIAASR